ncbi:predicted protein [Naegleria gruberi]|uniref:Predicted protein n=1 Tax=Naegleria gruberi TaxID=5762 RepID=D2VKQ4_NAEGR|nr:uncharacterized protein NAEGRDRAFT_69475 [Naegleria gruberi]EFC42732.1 predicted protein [Naegleria gruberi]|eukprot:XP_002675476.1 predicted protein [Naegleria gruberi strain NEG-M]
MKNLLSNISSYGVVCRKISKSSSSCFSSSSQQSRQYSNRLLDQPFVLERFFAKYEFSSKYLLCSSDCESMSIKELIGNDEDNLQALLNCHLGYTESKGDYELRDLIINTHPQWYDKSKLGAANVLIHTGGVEPILLFGMTCLEKDDHVIIQSPRYQALSEFSHVVKTRVSAWNAKKTKNGWNFDVNELESLIQPKTKAIILNPIHNPTGHLHTLEEINYIIEIAKKKNLLIFSDEVYRGLEYNETDASIPSLSSLYYNAISLNVMSKSYGLAGLRTGWVVSQNLQLLDSLLKGKDFTTICNPAPSECLSKIALKQSDQILTKNREIIATNFKLAEEFFTKRANHIFEWIPPRAGPIGYIHFKDWKEGSFRFCERVNRDCGVLLLPSTVYNRMDDKHLRIGLGRRNFAEGLSVLENYLLKNNTN